MTRRSANASTGILFFAAAFISNGMAGDLPTETVPGSRVAGVTIYGTVRYHSEAQRPWNLSRYYIANPKEGWLAEAVIALEGTNLPAVGTKKTHECVKMDQVNFQFVPETLALRTGDSIKVINSDDALHNVMTSDGQPFNVSLAKGQEFTQTFEHGGGLSHPIRVGCLFHSSMHAWIYVFDHPWFTVTQRDGRFQLLDVPPGVYTLGVVHPAGKLRCKRQIEIKAAATAPIEIDLSPEDRVSPN